KSVWLRAFRLNRGAHSTLSSFAVKRCFEVFFEAAFCKTPSTSTTYRLPRGVQRCEEANNTRFDFRVNTLI
ncbi:hypothetical protein OP492_25295, partial [Pseudomonas mosselii]|uniref:hypothetical protein n=1 Tax=Pseudomonas mosselii TaxID=78327 RepID=UPI001EE33BA8